jgi:hypothetical protein
MARKRISPTKYDAILVANANVCCVCKRRGIGVNVHHIDHDPSNDDPSNLAPLCIQEHDAHHRPKQYPALNHLDLGAEEIRYCKTEWERFVSEWKPGKVLIGTGNPDKPDLIDDLELPRCWESRRA